MELNEFVQKFASIFDDTDESEITADTVYQDLEEWGSLTSMSLIALVKTSYGKTVTGQEIRSCETVSELFNLIVAK